MAEPQTISSENLCKLTNLTDRRHRQLAADGYFPPPVMGQYQLTTTIQGLFRWFRTKSESTEAKAKKLDADTKRAIEEAKLARLDRMERENHLIPLEESKEVLRNVLAPVRQRILSMPLEMSARVNPSDPVFARTALDMWTDETLKICRDWIDEKTSK